MERIGELGSHPRAQQLRLANGLLAELLPLDERRRAEVTVFLDFTAAARTNPAFGDLSRQAAEGVRALVRRVLTRLDASGALRPGLDLGTETERLTALLDGLSQSSVLHPEVVSARTCADVLSAHLRDLAVTVEGPGPAR
ncbi:TetR family transcriptional regulator C-terminal domain-containing protein [Streptomyces sp. NBC_01565]|uniref:TetR family transcriptional regulator C-terminal domain-containing protein n=1 Tax=unclassified Streptomyces TaxID=2593676 RepID=UPI002251A1A8|nr:TetR family transcriptional regulator C-terminal domain-containing protein [Streptomyces sp. NBC_01565]MCX4545828.1 TetR family transcriptional regulator C-terminal domain-containing protein [Streptomyces sp. NBC_01565]